MPVVKPMRISKVLTWLSATVIFFLKLLVLTNFSTIIQTLPTPFGVYDLHFASSQEIQNGKEHPGSFAVASSTGSVALYRLLPSKQDDATFPHPKICHKYTIQYFSKDLLITSLDWRRHDLVAMTLSSGQVCLGRVRDPSDGPIISVELMQHDFQAWHCSFLASKDVSETEFGLISGGDDATLRYTPVDAAQLSALGFADTATNSLPTSPWADKKIHQAGVTAVMPIGSTSTGHLVITGSYDDHIRLLHVPNMGRREVLAEEYLEGGVFRIKLAERRGEGNSVSSETEESYTLIVSCMQAGARIVNLHKTGEQWHFDVKAKFEKNAGTLLYASDCQSTGADGKRTIVSTSFEDCKMYLWKANVSL
jgi:diphthamide biosynthesis protein 7